MSEELTAKSEIDNPKNNLSKDISEEIKQESPEVEATDEALQGDENVTGDKEPTTSDSNAFIAEPVASDEEPGTSENHEVQPFNNSINEAEELRPNSKFQHQNTPSAYSVSTPDLLPPRRLVSGSLHDNVMTDFATDIPGSVVESETNQPLKPDSGISSTEGNPSYEDNYIIINRMTDDNRNAESNSQLSNPKFLDDQRNSEPSSRSDNLSAGTTTASSGGHGKMRLANSRSHPISISSSNGIHHTSLRAAPLSVKITEVDERSGMFYGTLTDEPLFRHQQSNPDTIILTDRQISKPYYYNEQLLTEPQFNRQVSQTYNGNLYQPPVTLINQNQLGLNRNDMGVARTIYPELPYVEDFNNIGPGPTYVRCPKCNMKTLTRVDRKPSSCAFISGFFLCLCLLCYVPFCMRRCQAVDHYCIRCQTFLGRYSRC